jgi:hypothetical protein
LLSTIGQMVGIRLPASESLRAVYHPLTPCPHATILTAPTTPHTVTAFHLTVSEEIPPGSYICVGDLHGQLHLFEQFLQWVKGSGAQVCMLGDLIDRSPEPGTDLKVLERVYDLVHDPESWGLQSFTSLCGNHERMFLDCVDGYGATDWVRNGGDHENLDAMRPHAEWVRKLPYVVTWGNHMFTHSGGVHGKDPRGFLGSYAKREELVWARSVPNKGTGIKKWGNPSMRHVFGHSPHGEEVYEVPGNGLCIDTYAFGGGPLTAYNALNGAIMQFFH